MILGIEWGALLRIEATGDNGLQSPIDTPSSLN